jgi:hypothetical protein
MPTNKQLPRSAATRHDPSQTDADGNIAATDAGCSPRRASETALPPARLSNCTVPPGGNGFVENRDLVLTGGCAEATMIGATVNPAITKSSTRSNRKFTSFRLANTGPRAASSPLC